MNKVNKTIKMTRNELNKFIKVILKEEHGDTPVFTNAVSTVEPEDIVKVNPATDEQVSDSSLPVTDREWIPGNKKELAMAMKQIAEHIPEGQVEFVWVHLKSLISKAQENGQL